MEIRFACSEEPRPKLGRSAACTRPTVLVVVGTTHNAPHRWLGIHLARAPSATHDRKVRIPRKHERGRGDDLSERGY